MKRILTLIPIVILSFFFFNCSTTNQNYNSSYDVINEISAGTNLTNKDVMNYFCSSLTEYFNKNEEYKYYQINSEIYTDSLEQKILFSTRVLKKGQNIVVEYNGFYGKYYITFSKHESNEKDRVFTFLEYTELGNSIRRKIYQTYSAWLDREKIAMKMNGYETFFYLEVDASLELEKWINKLNNPNYKR